MNEKTILPSFNVSPCSGTIDLFKKNRIQLTKKLIEITVDNFHNDSMTVKDSNSNETINLKE